MFFLHQEHGVAQAQLVEHDAAVGRQGIDVLLQIGDVFEYLLVLGAQRAELPLKKASAGDHVRRVADDDRRLPV